MSAPGRWKYGAVLRRDRDDGVRVMVIHDQVGRLQMVTLADPNDSFAHLVQDFYDFGKVWPWSADRKFWVDAEDT